MRVSSADGFISRATIGLDDMLLLYHSQKLLLVFSMLINILYHGGKFDYVIIIWSSPQHVKILNTNSD